MSDDTLLTLLWFLPLAFIAGEHGFAFFAPYLAVVVAMLSLIRWRHAHLPKPVLATIASRTAGDDFGEFSAHVAHYYQQEIQRLRALLRQHGVDAGACSDPIPDP